MNWNFFDMSGLEKNVSNQKVTFWFILISEKDISCFFSCVFEKHDFELKNLLGVRFWIEKNVQVLGKKYNASFFELDKIAKRQILNWKEYNASDFKSTF